MSSPQLRRADRAMSEQRAYEMLERGFSGQLATIGADGYPYCIPLLYIWMDGELYVHTGSARGHLRANVEREPRVCFELDEPDQVFDYGRFECDSGLAYRSVVLFGTIRIVEERVVKQRFCEALMAKYGKPDTGRPKSPGTNHWSTIPEASATGSTAQRRSPARTRSRVYHSRQRL